MSQEDVELVKRGLGAVIKRPRPDFDTVNTIFHPDHDWIPVEAEKFGEAEAKQARGYKAWADALEGVMPFEADMDGAVDVAPGMVLAVMAMRFRGASSGIDVEQRLWLVVSVADGQITRTEAYMDPAGALEAVGVRESN